jgi:hypothetical protein
MLSSRMASSTARAAARGSRTVCSVGSGSSLVRLRSTPVLDAPDAPCPLPLDDAAEVLSSGLPAGADDEVAAALVEDVDDGVVDAPAVVEDAAGAEPPLLNVEGAEEPEVCVDALADCEGGDDCCDDEACGCL